MASFFTKSLVLFSAISAVHGYWLMGAHNFITTQRLDPLVSPGKVSSHAHSVVGGSNFGFETNTASLRQSKCTSVPIPQDKSNYWFPHLYFQWANGSFTSLTGGALWVAFDLTHLLYGPETLLLAVTDYLFDDKPGVTTAFPDDFRMLSGDPSLRSYDSSSFAQQAVSFLCLDFNGKPTTYSGLPNVACPSGVRAQINFPSCWDGKNTDSADHKSHVAFRSEGPDKGTCNDPKFPVTLPRIFMEVYWATNPFDSVRGQAMNKDQPFVFASGDPTGYGYHADFINGWDKGVLQNAVDKCHCNPFGDPQCCADQGIFTLVKDGSCHITDSIDEVVTGTLPKLPGNNPVQKGPGRVTTLSDPATPAILSPVYAYTGDSAPAKGSVATPASTARPTGAGSGFPIASSAASASGSIPGPSGAAPSQAPGATLIVDPPTASATKGASPPVVSAPSDPYGGATSSGVGPAGSAPPPAAGQPGASTGSPPPSSGSPPPSSGSSNSSASHPSAGKTCRERKAKTTGKRFNKRVQAHHRLAKRNRGFAARRHSDVAL
ncbi:hypothetical protein HGRIS_000963 [Hohenbuehelia grisea]|uniref:DUF1996 domain-containing protein n=1 Tax=Hohenbuehelia grisea TaxID=104357 RepID=A0ABR3IQF6_9AGAR